MNFLQWMAVLGVLLLILALASAYLRWMPVTSSLIYLGFGLIIGNLGIGLWEIEFVQIAGWMVHLTEIAVLVSLFVSGLKLRMPLRHPAWRSSFYLAGPVMLACIAGVAALCHFLLGLSWGIAVLIGATLAPTDPVLASLVQVNNSRDNDHVRYGLSGEAGLNDGTAFPFVVFGLLLIEQETIATGWVTDWALHRLVWAVPAGLALGYLLGRLIGKLAIFMRTRHADTSMSPNDSLALALIALAYVGAELIGAWGFLAVFAAGLGLRHAEMDAAQKKLSGKKKAGDKKLSSKEKIKVVDTDGDGILTAAEHESGSKSMFDRMDGDRDGFLNREELSAGHAKMLYRASK